MGGISKWKKIAYLIITIMLMLLSTEKSFAQAVFDLDWWHIGSGGGTSSGGDVELSGALGQPLAGGPVSGGDTTLTSGFMVGVVETAVAGPEIDVQGQGVSILDDDATPESADDTEFGEAAVDSDTVVHTFTIENKGEEDLNLTGSPLVEITGTHAADFTVTSSPSTPVAAGGGTTTFEITFDPGRDGLREAEISIANNDSDENPYNFAIQGTGTTTFADVPMDHWAYDYIETLYQSGITGGCGTDPLVYCPSDVVARDQMAVFLERGIHGANYDPPAPTGLFDDVPVDYWAAKWVEALYNDGITGGCGGNNYCPSDPVTRAQMAVFLLRSEHGAAYDPPAATGEFSDVPVDHWAADWIEQLAAEGITSGCGGGNYCPADSVTRDQMAVFLVRTFDLPIP
jgi:hypothetical protein